MGVYTNISVKAPMKCCGLMLDLWQSKDLRITVGESIIRVKHEMKTLPLEIITFGEIHEWCPYCEQMSRYSILNGELTKDKDEEKCDFCGNTHAKFACVRSCGTIYKE